MYEVLNLGSHCLHRIQLAEYTYCRFTVLALIWFQGTTTQCSDGEDVVWGWFYKYNTVTDCAYTMLSTDSNTFKGDNAFVYQCRYPSTVTHYQSMHRGKQSSTVFGLLTVLEISSNNAVCLSCYSTYLYYLFLALYLHVCCNHLQLHLKSASPMGFTAAPLS